MSTYYLLNTVTFGGNQYKSGKLIDSASVDVSALAAAGAVLVTSANAIVANAAALVVDKWKQGYSPEYCDGMMFAAYTLSKDTVDTEKLYRTLDIAGNSLPAKGVAVHAQVVGGAALDLVAGFTNPLPRRTLNIARSNAGPANVTYRCYGKTGDGETTYEDVVVAKAGNATGTKALEWTRITTSVDPVSTSDFVTGDGFSVGFALAAEPAIACIGVAEAVAASELTSGTVVPTTAPNGVKSFTLLCEEDHAHALS